MAYLVSYLIGFHCPVYRFHNLTVVARVDSISTQSGTSWHPSKRPAYTARAAIAFVVVTVDAAA